MNKQDLLEKRRKSQESNTLEVLDWKTTSSPKVEALETSQGWVFVSNTKEDVDSFIEGGIPKDRVNTINGQLWIVKQNSAVITINH